MGRVSLAGSPAYATVPNTVTDNQHHVSAGSEFRRVAELIVTSHSDMDLNINVSVFETNIRVVGGLLGAHLMLDR